MPPPVMAKKPEKINGIQKRTLIQITIAQDASNDWKIYMYPQRESDVVIYRKAAGKGHPAKPEQIRWVIEGLQTAQNLTLRTKAGDTNVFPDSPFTISGKDDGSSTTIESGAPDMGEEWNYDIILYTGSNPDDPGSRLDIKDPTIEVKDDP